MKTFTLISHATVLGLGFALGIYTLPILTAPPAPSEVDIQVAQVGFLHQTTFVRDLPGSDFLHWGEGEVTITPSRVIFEGELAPGPDYRLYLAPAFANDEGSFLQIKSQAVEVGAIKRFENFIVNLPEGVNPDDYNTVLVWCESFGEFITAAKYK